MQVWFERSRLVRHLLVLGYNVVQSDGDALWLQNPMYEESYACSLVKSSDLILYL